MERQLRRFCGQQLAGPSSSPSSEKKSKECAWHSSHAAAPYPPVQQGHGVELTSWIASCRRTDQWLEAEVVLATVHQRPQYHNSRCLASTLCYWGDPAVPPELQVRSYDLPSEARSPAAEDAGWWWDFCGIARRSSKRRCRPREGSLHPRPVQSL